MRRLINEKANAYYYAVRVRDGVFRKTSLAYALFRKQYSQLTPEERRLYKQARYREAKRKRAENDPRKKYEGI